MASTITTPVTTRIRPSDHEDLRRLAIERGMTVSSLLASLARRELAAQAS
jgi:hypothetical protein